MPDKHLIGLIHSLRSSAEAALGEPHSPLTLPLARGGALARRTAERSLDLLEMLERKTRGNLDDTERAALLGAISSIRETLASTTDPGAG